MAICRKPNGRLISLILPVYNEVESLPFVFDELYAYIGAEQKDFLFEIMCIDDGSTDESVSVILEHAAKAPANVRVSVSQLSKNSGGHIAITAGLNISRGDFTIVMASDGQDPAPLIGELIERWQNGHNILLAARRVNLDQGRVGQFISLIAWRLMAWSTQINAPRKGCDVLGLDRLALDAFNRMDERNTTFIFRVLSMGFRRDEFEYDKRARTKGQSSWNIWRKLYIFFDAVTGYSSRPLRLITGMGIVVFFLIIFRWLLVLYNVYVLGNIPTDLEVILNSIFSSLSVVIILLGAIGDYIWRILEETRKRPIYDINDVKGRIFDDV